jgi:hypothetical protein
MKNDFSDAHKLADILEALARKKSEDGSVEQITLDEFLRRYPLFRQMHMSLSAEQRAGLFEFFTQRQQRKAHQQNIDGQTEQENQ